ncbi:hypothetical protein C2E23DRAFT_417264 [Lenzites betulinus]|nr:hypothetical protein C2E23DRAFT_417264 [Lenzites betulinus]
MAGRWRNVRTRKWYRVVSTGDARRFIYQLHPRTGLRRHRASHSEHNILSSNPSCRRCRCPVTFCTHPTHGPVAFAMGSSGTANKPGLLYLAACFPRLRLSTGSTHCAHDRLFVSAHNHSM